MGLLFLLNLNNHIVINQLVYIMGLFGLTENTDYSQATSVAAQHQQQQEPSAILKEYADLDAYMDDLDERAADIITLIENFAAQLDAYQHTLTESTDGDDVVEKNLIIRQIQNLHTRIKALETIKDKSGRLAALWGLAGIVGILLSYAISAVAAHSGSTGGVVASIIGIVTSFVLVCISVYHGNKSAQARQDLANIGRKIQPQALELLKRAPKEHKEAAAKLYEKVDELVEDSMRIDQEAAAKDRRDAAARHYQMMSVMTHNARRPTTVIHNYNRR
jgi:hypothetical protein